MKEEIESKLFELVESKSYNELTTKERQLVDLYSSQEEFESQRAAILAMDDFHEIAVPRPLVLHKKSGIIPFVWTSVGSAAAAVLLLLWLMPESSNSFEVNWVTPEVRSVDTLIVERTVRDTVIAFREEKKEVREENVAANQQQEMPLFEQDASITDAQKIQRLDLKNKGVAATNDLVIQRFKPVPFVGM